MGAARASGTCGRRVLGRWGLSPTFHPFHPTMTKGLHFLSTNLPWCTRMKPRSSSTALESSASNPPAAGCEASRFRCDPLLTRSLSEGWGLPAAAASPASAAVTAATQALRHQAFIASSDVCLPGTASAAWGPWDAVSTGRGVLRVPMVAAGPPSDRRCSFPLSILRCRAVRAAHFPRASAPVPV